uniref:Efflux RND transporter permease subunit n=1 Tax=candidate division WOR-3 bacterium TaxID=2052148 RepID=A0A7C4Y529_UNCW3
MIKWFLERPVSLVCIYFIIFVLGIISILKLPIELYPEVEFPSISISFYWNGASPEAVERYLTREVESIIYKLNGVKNVESISKRDGCIINVDFEREIDVAYQRIVLLEEISRVDFPLGIVGPFISENIPEEIERGKPFVLYITGPYSLYEIGEYAKKLKIFLSKIYGIKEVEIYGDVEEVVKVKIKNSLFKPDEIFERLNEKKVSAGRIKKEGDFIPIICIPYEKIEDIKINDIPIKKIADIEYSYKEPDVISRINGFPQITLNISVRQGGNILLIEREIKRVIKNFPLKEGMKIIIERNEAEIIKTTLKKIVLLGILSILGVFFIMFIFFKNIYNVFVITSSIIFSSLLAFIMLYFFRFSLNVLTLSGIALGFGMLVDNSIVVFDNIMRLKETKKEEPEIKGTKEVFIPIFASTLTNIAVYIPFLYFKGELKIFYKQFAIASSFALLSSIFVAFTLIPSLSKKCYGVKGKKFLPYKNMLNKLFKFRWITISLTLILIFLSIYLFNYYVNKGDVFIFKERNKIHIYVDLPSGSEKKEAIKIADEFENVIKKYNYLVKNFYTNISRTRIYINIEIFPNKSGTMIKEELENHAVKFTNCRIFIYGIGDLFSTGTVEGRGGFPQFTLKGYDYSQLKNISKGIGMKIRENPRITDIDLNFSWEGKQKEYIISPKENLEIFGITPYKFLRTIKSHYYSEIELKDRILPVEIYQETLIGLKEFKDKEIKMGIKTSDISNITEEETPNIIKRENQEYTMDIAYTFNGKYEKAEEFKKSILNSILLPDGFSIEEYQFVKPEEGINRSTVITSILLALFILMAILASLYESIAKPLLILFILPFSFVGVVLVYLIGTVLFDSSSFVGVLLFSGIAVNNGIILIDHLSKARQKKDEIIEYSSHRLRPIFTTSFTTIIGLFPFLFLKSEVIIFSKLSLTTIGGLIFSVIGSVIILPVLYYTFFVKEKNEDRL